MHTLTIQNISDDFLEPFLALAKAVKANVITEKEDDDENWEKEMEEALKEAKDIIANPQNYKFYKTVDEMWAAMEQDDD